MHRGVSGSIRDPSRPDSSGTPPPTRTARTELPPDVAVSRGRGCFLWTRLTLPTPGLGGPWSFPLSVPCQLPIWAPPGQGCPVLALCRGRASMPRSQRALASMKPDRIDFDGTSSPKALGPCWPLCSVGARRPPCGLTITLTSASDYPEGRYGLPAPHPHLARASNSTDGTGHHWVGVLTLDSASKSLMANPLTL